MLSIRSAFRRAAPRRALAAALALELSTVARPSRAWLLHEHARIGQSAIREHLGQRERQVLDAAWTLSRSVGAGQRRLCAAADARWQTQDDGSRCVGFSTLPALAGDHSCSPDDLETT